MPGREESGFTVTEVLVVTAVVAVLGAVATPAMLDKRIAAYDAAAMSDLRHEAVRVAQIVLSDESATAADLIGAAQVVSPGVAVELEAFEPGVGYCLSAQHEESPHVWHWNSSDATVLPHGASCPWDAAADDDGSDGAPTAPGSGAPAATRPGSGGANGKSDTAGQGVGCLKGAKPVDTNACEPTPGKGRTTG